MNLDMLAGLFVGLMALCAFTLDILSSPHRAAWMTLPKHIRWEVRVTGALLMIWSVNLFSLSGSAIFVIGHVNYEALAVLFSMAITVVSLTIYVASLKLPGRAWERLVWALTAMRRTPGAVPVMVQDHEVTELAHAMGQAAVGPNEGAQAVVREGRRMAPPAGE